jgi:tRNA-uridine 2-sulfurtransferase
MKTLNPKNIVVGMSGGVDSAVAALLLKQQGHHVTGVFMKNWEADDTDDYCPASQDVADAQAVCDILGIELQRVNFAAEYWENVFTHFLDEYRAGRTPNPDILCNKEIKFKAFLAYAKNNGADYIATGHYARCEHTENGAIFLKGLDNQKDQSYFLYALAQEQLKSSLFPIGDLAKPTVRTLATAAGFKNHAKKDSTGICFIGERKFKKFLNEYLPAQPGDIETPEGKKIGKHDGLMFYTLGQRQGLKIGGTKAMPESPWYVVKKDLARNILIAAQGQDHPMLYSRIVNAEKVHWINQPHTSFPAKITAKTRYRQPDQECIINSMGMGCYQIVFDQPQRAITPGQSVVFYQQETCLGGGIIVTAE